MFKSLRSATRNRGIVVATPTTIKSVMLSYIESLHHLRKARNTPLMTQKKLKELRNNSEILERVLRLFKKGVMLLDEVDLILHPLRSELNFPIGQKFDLDLADDGARWSLPMHLLDAIFFHKTSKYILLVISRVSVCA